jgi:hypothetical protein
VQDTREASRVGEEESGLGFEVKRVEVGSGLGIRLIQEGAGDARRQGVYDEDHTFVGVVMRSVAAASADPLL